MSIYDKQFNMVPQADNNRIDHRKFSCKNVNHGQVNNRLNLKG